MKTQNILLVPIAFVAGIVTIVLLERGGLVRIDHVFQTSSTSSAELLPNQQDSGAAADAMSPDTPASRSATSNIDESMSGERLSERIDALQQQLRSATVNADKMLSKINALEQQIEETPIGTEFLPAGENSSALPGEALAGQGNQRNRLAGFGSPDNDVQYNSLVSAGVDPLVAEQLKQRSDQWTLQRLELIDQATREGWRRSDQFSERLTDLQEERPNIRDELGDSEYDRYLYESGDNNRVQISSIINGSAAQLAGMEDGDLVLSYANQRVYSLRELQQATSEGSRGEPVQLEVLRAGEQVSIELPRGPMGVTLTGRRIEPAAF